MEGFLRVFGWLGTAALVLLFIDGALQAFGIWWHPGLHVGAGIGVLLVVPLLYVLPYFQLIGVGAALERAEGLEERAARRALLVELKGRIFWPVLRTILLLVVGPILGFLERGGQIPQWSHGAVMGLHLVAHIDLWARSLFVLGLARELLKP